MTFRTHINCGLTAALVLCGGWISGVLTLIGSVLPDIDHKSSILGKSFPFISRFLKHRGFTHSIVFLFLCYIINPFLMIGAATHLIADMMTGKGIKLVWPMDKYIHFPLSKHIVTNGKFETLFFWCLIIINIALICLIGAEYCGIEINKEEIINKIGNICV